jgi:Mce-associated membrane protein
MTDTTRTRRTEPTAEGAEPAGRDGRAARRRRGASVACRALAAAAAIFLGWSCWTFWDLRQGDMADMARDRDHAMRAAKQQIAALNTMDARRVDQGLRSWLDASTGPLHEELRRTRTQSRRQIQRAGTSATGVVSDAALTALDRRAGSARVIATVRIDITRPGAAPTVQRRRYEATLARAAEGWKLKSLTALPVNTR